MSRDHQHLTQLQFNAGYQEVCHEELEIFTVLANFVANAQPLRFSAGVREWQTECEDGFTDGSFSSVAWKVGLAWERPKSCKTISWNHQGKESFRIVRTLSFPLCQEAISGPNIYCYFFLLKHTQSNRRCKKRVQASMHPVMAAAPTPLHTCTLFGCMRENGDRII